jgi:hypothetical protein
MTAIINVADYNSITESNVERLRNQLHGIGISCGVRFLYGLYTQIAGIQGPVEIVAKSHSSGCRPPFAILVFSDNMNTKNLGVYDVTNDAMVEENPGPALAQYIVAEKLGPIVETPDDVINPNSTNPIKVWSWCINWPALDKWWADRKDRVKAERGAIRLKLEHEHKEYSEIVNKFLKEHGTEYCWHDTKFREASHKADAIVYQLKSLRYLGY